jgi:hypothetical protein
MRSFALRFVAIYVVAGTVAVLWERPLDAAVAPLVKLGLGLGSDIDVRDVASEGHRLRASVIVTRSEQGVRERHLHANVVANGDTMLVGPLLAIAAVAAWSYRSARSRALGVTLGTLSALLLSAHDAAASIAFAIRAKLGTAGSWSEFYSFFLDAGGRQLLALAAAGLAIQVAERFVGRQPKTSAAV